MLGSAAELRSKPARDKYICDCAAKKHKTQKRGANTTHSFHVDRSTDEELTLKYKYNFEINVRNVFVRKNCQKYKFRRTDVSEIKIGNKCQKSVSVMRSQIINWAGCACEDPSETCVNHRENMIRKRALWHIDDVGSLLHV